MHWCKLVVVCVCVRVRVSKKEGERKVCGVSLCAHHTSLFVFMFHCACAVCVFPNMCFSSFDQRIFFCVGCRLKGMCLILNFSLLYVYVCVLCMHMYSGRIFPCVHMCVSMLRSELVRSSFVLCSLPVAQQACVAPWRDSQAFCSVAQWKGSRCRSARQPNQQPGCVAMVTKFEQCLALALSLSS